MRQKAALARRLQSRFETLTFLSHCRLFQTVMSVNFVASVIRARLNPFSEFSGASPERMSETD